MKHISKATLGFGTLGTDEVWDPQFLSAPCTVNKHGYTYYASVNDAPTSPTTTGALRSPTPERDTLKWGCEKLAETAVQAVDSVVGFPNRPVVPDGMSAKLNCSDTGTIFLVRFTPYVRGSDQWSFMVKVSVLVTSAISPERLAHLAEDVLDVLRKYTGTVPQEARHIVFYVHELKTTYPASRNVLITGDRQSGKTRELIRSALYYARTNPTKRVTLCVPELEISWDRIYDAHRGDYAGDRLEPFVPAVIPNAKAVVQALYPNVHFDLYDARLFTNLTQTSNRARGFHADALFINLLPADTRFFKVFLEGISCNKLVETIVVDLDIMTTDMKVPESKLSVGNMRTGINNSVAFLNKCGLRRVDVVQPKYSMAIGNDRYESFIHRGLGVQDEGNYMQTILVTNRAPLPTLVANIKAAIDTCNNNPSNNHLIEFRLITDALDHIDYYVNYALQTLVGSDSSLLVKLAAGKTVQERLQTVLSGRISSVVSWALSITPDGRGIREKNNVVHYTLSPERPSHYHTLESWEREIKYLGDYIKNKETCGVEIHIPTPLSNMFLHAITSGFEDATRDDIVHKKINDLLLKHGFDAVVKTVVSRAGDIW